MRSTAKKLYSAATFDVFIAQRRCGWSKELSNFQMSKVIIILCNYGYFDLFQWD